MVPYKYTQEGYAAYVAGKEARRELFIQNVLGTKMKNNEPKVNKEKPKVKCKKSK